MAARAVTAAVVLQRYSGTAVERYRHFHLKYTPDSLCGVKFRHMWDLRFPVWAYGLYCTVVQLYRYRYQVPVPVPVQSQESTVPVRYQRPEAYRTVGC